MTISDSSDNKTNMSSKLGSIKFWAEFSIFGIVLFLLSLPFLIGGLVVGGVFSAIKYITKHIFTERQRAISAKIAWCIIVLLFMIMFAADFMKERTEYDGDYCDVSQCR